MISASAGLSGLVCVLARVAYVLTAFCTSGGASEDVCTGGVGGGGAEQGVESKEERDESGGVKVHCSGLFWVSEISCLDDICCSAPVRK